MKINVIVITQDEQTFIPQNIILLNQLDGLNIDSVVVQKTGAIVKNKALHFLRGFGIVQISKLLLHILSHKLKGIFSNILRLAHAPPASLKAAASGAGANYFEIKNVNSNVFIDYVTRNNIDLIISYSAPSKFSSALIAAPKLGCINLHCSLLPKYAGIMPSFWALYNGETEFGATLHCMGDEIDNGAIIKQTTVDIGDEQSIHKVIAMTKTKGGEMVVDCVKKIMDEGELIATEYVSKPVHYHGWPSVEQIREFKKIGGRLI